MRDDDCENYYSSDKDSESVIFINYNRFFMFSIKDWHVIGQIIAANIIYS